MKKILLTAICMLSLSAFAQPPVAPQGPHDQPPPPMGQPHKAAPEDFQKHKQFVLERLNKEGQLVASTTSCVQAAASHDALRACMERAMETRHAMHEEMRGERERQMPQPGMGERGMRERQGMQGGPRGMGPQGGPDGRSMPNDRAPQPQQR